MQTKTQISSGGVVFRRTGPSVEVVIISVGETNRWQLPKGLVDRGESPEIAARREVREETGLEAELLAPIETIEYWYVSKDRGKPVRFHKFVHFYLLRYLSGDTSQHDQEVNEARWVEIDQAEAMLAFETERKMVSRAKGMIGGFD
jgi:8-oxo-dGTP pyrophosphatase MutT (NUDIX family)